MGAQQWHKGMFKNMGRGGGGGGLCFSPTHSPPPPPTINNEAPKGEESRFCLFFEVENSSE